MQCPACAETIAEGTRLCPHCHSDVVEFAANWAGVRPASGPSRGRRASQPVRLLVLLGCLGLGSAVLLGLAGLVGVWWTQFEAARYASRRVSQQRDCQGQLRRIADALRIYHDTCGSFPPAITRNAAGEPMHSWRVLILPFLDGGPRDLDYRLDEPWDSPHNSRVTATTPEVFRCPGNDRGAKFGTTHYLAIDGPQSVLNSQQPARLQDILDGPGGTMMVVEGRDPAVHWAQPRDLEIGRGTGFGPDGMSSDHSDGFHAVMADGTVRFISYWTGVEGLRGLSTIDGGETVDAFR
jgi:hypothetical protein